MSLQPRAQLSRTKVLQHHLGHFCSATISFSLVLGYTLDIGKESHVRLGQLLANVGTFHLDRGASFTTQTDKQSKDEKNSLVFL